MHSLASLFRIPFFILVGTIALSSLQARDLPPFIKPCKRSDTNFEICLIGLINNLKTQLAEGIAEMKIQALDPFYLSSVEFGPDSGIISVNEASFENITVHGCSNFTLTNISVDFQTPKLMLDVVIPLARINCNYNISASTFFFPVAGDGMFSGNFTNVSGHAVIYGEYYTKNNLQYVRIVNHEISVDIDSSEAHLEDTGNSLKNSLMNDFWPTLFTVIKPKAEIKIGQIAVSIFKDMLELYNVYDLAPQ